MLKKIMISLTGFVLVSSVLHAGEVAIMAVDFQRAGGDWTVKVTLQHADTGWKHYADAWRVVDGNGKVLSVRTLYHPHVKEQPFSRSLANVMVPEKISRVYVEAHDKKHGWSKDRVMVDLTKHSGKRFTVR